MIGGLFRDKSRFLLAGASVIAVMAMSAPATAQDNAAIQAQIQALQAQINTLQKQVGQAQAAAAAAQKSGGGGDLDLKVKWKGAPEFSSVDGKFKMKVRGRIMVDYNNIDQDESITGEGDISAAELRRARLGIEGVVFYNWKYKFEYDFTSGGDFNAGGIKDAYVAFANWGPDTWETSEIRFGNQYVYNSLEQITSSRFITFMERAAFTEAFFLDRQIGAAVLAGGEHWSFQTGYYGTSVEDQGTWDDDTTSASIRLTVAPINNDTTVLHLGASYRNRQAGEDRAGFVVPFEYRARGADLHLADRFVDTPDIGDEDNMFVLEGAFVWKSLSVQGEYAELKSDTPNLLSTVDPTYDGWYVDGSWYITGEMRNYEASTGEFGRTKVKNPVLGDGRGGWGAWQIAARYDVINLSDGNAVIPGCTECGDQETWLIGLNWWLTDYTALKFNVTQSKITGGNDGFPRGSLLGFNRNDGAEITGFGMRAQVDW